MCLLEAIKNIKIKKGEMTIELINKQGIGSMEFKGRLIQKYNP